MQILRSLLSVGVLMSIFVGQNQANQTIQITVPSKQLEPAPEKIEQFIEIATQYNNQLPALWNNLLPQERIFAYYLYRASIAGNRIYADQLHHDAVELISLFERIITHKDLIDDKEFIKQAELFLVYLFAHHGQYFLKEFEDHKRTPDSLKLSLLTPHAISAALKKIGVKNADEILSRLHNSLFNKSTEPTITVDGSIEKSSGNFYSPDFTQADFDSLPLQERSAINSYFYVEIVNGQRIAKIEKYKIGGRYSKELQTAHYWLSKACAHAKEHPAIFDPNIAASLEHLLNFFVSGDEQDFRKFSIEWIKTNSRIDFNFGFIEVYMDPKQYRGSFEADITIKTINMATFNALLPSLEKQLPFPQEFMRENLDDISAIPNASVNAKLFGSGEAGPVKITAAYCLPNYADIRAQYGSKQIIYQQGKGLQELINPTLARRLFYCKADADWLDRYDPQGHLDNDIWDVHVMLHETLGHGSGKLHVHTFKEGDPLVIDGKTFAIGDSLLLDKENINEFLGNYFSGLEELRAEIIALYTSIYNFDELAASGLFKDWPEKIGKEKLIEWFLLHMARQGLKRLLVQKNDATEIVQAHAQANTTIMNYLLDHGGMKIIEQTHTVHRIPHTIIDLKIENLAHAIQAVKDLAIEVQRIKSTADGQALKSLMKQYGTCIRHPEYIKILKANRQAVQGNLKEIAEIFPRLIPAKNTQGTITDISAEWPASFLEHQLELNQLALKTD